MALEIVTGAAEINLDTDSAAAGGGASSNGCCIGVITSMLMFSDSFSDLIFWLSIKDNDDVTQKSKDWIFVCTIVGMFFATISFVYMLYGYTAKKCTAWLLERDLSTPQHICIIFATFFEDVPQTLLVAGALKQIGHVTTWGALSWFSNLGIVAYRVVFQIPIWLVFGAQDNRSEDSIYKYLAQYVEIFKMHFRWIQCIGDAMHGRCCKVEFEDGDNAFCIVAIPALLIFFAYLIGYNFMASAL